MDAESSFSEKIKNGPGEIIQYPIFYEPVCSCSTAGAPGNMLKSIGYFQQDLGRPLAEDRTWKIEDG